MRKTLAASVLILSLGTSAVADKVTRTVEPNGVPKISIRGQTAKSSPSNSRATNPSRQAEKEFQVYELDGDSAPAVATPPSQPTVIVVSSPPPIAPNPGAVNYGYGYPYGYFGYPVGWGYPHFGPGWHGPRRHPVNTPYGPVNYQNRPVNYQNPPANYQNRPVNYQNRPVNYQNPPVRYR